jgi:hypothetical protein
LDVTRAKEGDGLRGSVVLNTRPYENWVERARGKNSKEFPLWALPELRGFSGEETEVLAEAESFRFGDRIMYEDEPDYGIKSMMACRPPRGAFTCLYGRFRTRRGD